jgi:ATP-dependent RNA helicase RhlE
VQALVLDEADRLLDMGFIRDVRRLVRMTPSSRQSLLFSATMPKEITSLAAEILERPVRVDVSPKAITVERIVQLLIRADSAEKRWVLEHLLHNDDVSRALVFTRTKHGANKVVKNLLAAGITAEALHGNKSQSARQRALQNFKQGNTWVLVATDIAARGIDVQGISHVINYELPDDPESYVHRIGRTARAGAGGVAWSLYDPSESKRLRDIERLVGRIPDEAAAALAEMRSKVSAAAAQRPAAAPVASASQDTRGTTNGRPGGRPGARSRVRGGRAGGRSNGSASGESRGASSANGQRAGGRRRRTG